MSEKEEIKCRFCGEISNKADLPMRIVTTDIYLGMDWGIPSWKEDEIRMCPNCNYSLMLDNKEIEYKTREDINKLECIKAFKLKYHTDYVNTNSQKFKQFQYKWNQENQNKSIYELQNRR